ncbi:bleomycin hydrolase [Tenacibaculum sp. MAR_2009_124]|uniref:C1 family peptidase n=1 Tax=Tenacibaculum sp. MAR_2009_124 TaxID=1250059 RepID=UPI000895D382|nr:C1 family peptidase [Tenacibaculum sp. MAR_2009_124]SED08486.1 bleomycin hydrolase [Tenacibaculum sp. MAR_2009_124]
MKKISVTLFFLFLCIQLLGQATNEYKIHYFIKSSPLKNQQSSGTCWSFATTSFIETEAIRLRKEPISLSPIFYVHPTYIEKAKKYIDSEGKSRLDSGDLTFSVLKGYSKYGAIPEIVYNGIIEEDWQHDHVEMDNAIEAMIKSIATSGYGRIKPSSWKKALQGVLNAYLGKIPDTFIYEQKEYTPKSFAREFVSINTNDYIEITSYSHYPFYENFILNIPANWGENLYLNVPIKDFELLIDNALKKGYSLAWDGDASEPNFNFKSGVAKLTLKEELIAVTQEMRQKAFEDGTTNDDHNMHLLGKATDEAGKEFYIMKNSEGMNDKGGYVYMSKNALMLKTISVLVHKNALPKEISKKLKI